ncbi:MAG TPA: hypothetical protein VFE58_18220 [Tepidisphaeraceae bacterium]|jgi:hypothetical protein|nr:hypothetical protein [Tepidisphaeraceae bacterium]
MNDTVNEAWKNYLNPEVQRFRLLSSSIFIAVFESLKDAIIERARGIFWRGFNEGGDNFDPRYESEVLNRRSSPVYASLDWLREQGAIDADDILAFDDIKSCRNKLAHELFTVVCSSGLPTDFEQRLGQLISLMRKIEIWWIMNMEDIDPNTKESDIVPGRLLNLDLLFRIGLQGDRSLYDALEVQLNTHAK